MAAQEDEGKQRDDLLILFDKRARDKVDVHGALLKGTINCERARQTMNLLL